jgi:hypothetical protein
VVDDGWDAGIHVIDPFVIPPSWPRYWGVAFGFTNPMVVQQWAEDPDGRLVLNREFYRVKTLVKDVARDVLWACRALDGVGKKPDWLKATDRQSLSVRSGTDSTPAARDGPP